MQVHDLSLFTHILFTLCISSLLRPSVSGIVIVYVLCCCIYSNYYRVLLLSNICAS
jgi:hypothetical protein